jgi:hypothetical protein
VQLWKVDGSSTFHDVTQVQVDDATGRIAVSDAEGSFVMAADGGSRTPVAPNSCGDTCPDFVFGADWLPSGNLALLYAWYDDVEPYAEHRALGSYDTGTGALTQLRELPVPADTTIEGPLLVSPDGTEVAYTTNTTRERTDVAPLTAAGQPVRLVGDGHVAWQPCPAGVCPVFHLTPKPGKPSIRHASSGDPGGRPTMTVRWAPPTNADRAAIDSWKVIVARVNSDGHVVGTAVEVVLQPAAVSRVLRGYSGGRYKFQVRAHGVMGMGPHSAWSNIVRPR